RRARPTLRLIQEDLTAGWESPQPRRLLVEGIPDALHPLSELPHPIVTKAMESFGPEAANDNHVGPIAASTQLRLMEVKTGQWRGGVWKDPGTGVHWLVVAGLARGWAHPSLARLFLYETDRSRLPGSWLRWAMRTLQVTRKTNQGTPVDNQIGSYRLDADVLVTADRVFHAVVERVVTEAVVPVAVPVLVTVNNCLPKLTDLLQQKL